MNSLRYWAVLAVMAMTGFTTVPSSAATSNYGSPAAQAALQFDPYRLNAGAVSGDAFLTSNAPIIAPKGAAVQTASVNLMATTPVTSPAPVLNVVDSPKIFEGPYLSGLKASFVITLTKPASVPITVSFRTINGTARAGIEYAAKTGKVTIPAGRLAQVVLVDVLNDNLAIGNTSNKPYDRTFFLEIFQPTNGAKIGRSRGIAEIFENQQKAVGVTVSNALPIYEFNGGLQSTFTVSLNKASSQVVKVNYQTVNGTAKAGSDYQAKSGTLTFSAGQTMKSVTVQVFDNVGSGEAVVEEFLLRLSNPQNAILLRQEATAQIVEYTNGSNPPSATPKVSISPANQTVSEGNTGTKAVGFTIQLSKSSASQVKVSFSTANAGAAKGSDYVANFGTLTFAPGQLTKSVTVLVNGDNVRELDEAFNVNIYSPTGATLGNASAKTTITNDD